MAAAAPELENLDFEEDAAAPEQLVQPEGGDVQVEAAQAAKVSPKSGRPALPRSNLAPICENVKAHGKFPYCQQCKRDVHACHADAKACAHLQTYHDRGSWTTPFREMILEYQRTCASQG